MTVEHLVETVLRMVRTGFYRGRPDREWYRDLSAIQGAIGRYGYACQERGWELRAEEIATDLAGLLRSFADTYTHDGTWFPRYLEAAIDKHIRLRAEELAAASKLNAGDLAKRVIAGQDNGRRDASAVAALAALRAAKVGRPRGGRVAAGPRQMKLF